MAIYSVPVPKLTLTESSTKSLLLINPATVSIKLRQIDISLLAKEAAEEVQFDLYRVVTIGTPEGEALTPVKYDAADIAATSSVTIAKASEGGFKKEPTTVEVIDSWALQPFGGVLTLQYPFGGEVVGRATGARIGIRFTTSTSKPPCLCTLAFEE